MERGTPSTGNKTSWSKPSAVLLINIVKDVEQRILKKELVVGKENERTKWDYVAAFLHGASAGDASKTPNNCQYKFWELNRHYKFLLKETDGKKVAEEKDGPIFAALKSYYGNCPPIKKKKRPQRRIELFKDPGNKLEGQMDIQNPHLQLVRLPVPDDNDALCESEDDSGGSLQNLAHGESVGQLVTTSQLLEQSGDDSAGSPLHNASGEKREQKQPRRPRGRPPKSKRKASDLESPSQLSEQSEDDGAGSPLHNAIGDVAQKVRRPRGRPPKSKSKASDLESPDLHPEEKEGKRSSHRLEQMVDKMARLTSYMKWKETGVGEDWRCILTERIERRQKRTLRNQTNNVIQAHEASEAEVTDEIEAALREDILSFWNELDKKPPTEQECHKYFLKKYAGEVRY